MATRSTVFRKSTILPTTPSRLQSKLPSKRPIASKKITNSIAPFLYAGAVSVASLMLASCGGGGGSSSSGGTTPTPSSTVSAVVQKGPVNNASCTLFSSGNVRLAGPVTSASGVVSFGSVSGLSDGQIVYISCTGGKYTDEATGASTDLSTLRGSSVVGSSVAKVIITPVSEIAFRKSKSDLTDFSTQASNVATALGLDNTLNVTTTTPTDLNTQTSNGGAEGQYGTLLATLAQFQKDNSFTLDQTLTKLEQNIAGSTIGNNVGIAMQKAINNLIASTTSPATAHLDSASTTSVYKNLGTQSGTLPLVTLSSATPSAVIQGAAGSANWSLVGTGFYAGIPVKFNNLSCRSTGTVNSAGTQISGADCSNVTAPTSATSTSLKVGVASIDVQLSAAPAPSFSAWSSGSNPSVSVGGSKISSTTALAAPTGCNGAITYSIQTTPASDVATISPTTGVVTSGNTAGTGTVTASSSAVQGICATGTTSYNFTVSATLPNTVSGLTSQETKTYGDVAYKIAAVCAAGNQPTYSTSSSAISVDSTGKITILAATGTTSAGANQYAVVTATCPATTGYSQATGTYSVAVTKATPVLGFTNPITAMAVGTTITNTATLSGLKNNDTSASVGGTITYGACSVNAAGTATINASTGQVTSTGQGSVSFSATYSGSANYNTLTSKCYDVAISKTTPTLSFSNPVTSVVIGGTATNTATLSGLIGGDTATTVTSAGGTTSYTSSNPAIASVNSSTGKVTGVAAGSTTIIATFYGTAKYAAANATYTITTTGVYSVLPLQVLPSSTNTFTLTGTNLSSSITVTLNGSACTAVTLVSSTKLTASCTSPSSSTAVNLVASNGSTVLFTQSIQIAAISIAQIDVAQVISQPVASTYQILVPNRDALVRAYVYAAVANTAAPAVTLTASGGTAIAMTCPTTLPTSPPAAPIRLYSKAATCYANLPASAVASGLSLTVAIAGGNSLTVKPVLSTKPVINVVAVPLSFTTINGVVRTATLPTDAAIAASIKSRFPFASVNVTHRATFTLSSNSTYHENLAGTAFSATSEFSNALSQLETVRQSDGATDKLYYGFVPYTTGAGGSVAGLGYVGNGYSNMYYSAIGFDTQAYYYAQTMNHEIGHNLSLEHAPCGGADTTDSFWTQSPLPWVGADTGKLNSAALYEQVTDSLIDPTSVAGDYNQPYGTDMMGYCGGTWFSEYNYNKIGTYVGGATIPIVSAMATASTPKVFANAAVSTLPTLRFSGTIKNGKATLSPIQSAQGLSVTANTGDYLLRLTTVSGQTIYQYFQPAEVADSGTPESHFSITVSDPGRLVSVEILKNGVSLYASAPQTAAMAAAASNSSSTTSTAGTATDGVTISEANGQITLLWNNSAYPWLQLTHVASNGKRTTLAVQVKGGKLVLPLAGISAGGAWEVSLSDGLNTVLKSVAR